MREFWMVLAFFCLGAALVGWMVQNSRREERKQLEKLRKEWGRKRETKKSGEKKEKLSAQSREKKQMVFTIDDITWNDLEMDRIFETTDHTVSVCGEEYLYQALRMPATDAAVREEREALAELFEKNQTVRETVQSALLGIGKEKENPPEEELSVLMQAEPGNSRKYLLLSGLAVASVILLFLIPPLGVAALFVSMVGNGLVHGAQSRETGSPIRAMAGILRIERAAKELGKKKIPELSAYQTRLTENEKQLRSLTRKCATLVNTKGTEGGAGNLLFAYLHTFFLLDLLEYHAVIRDVKAYEKNIRSLIRDLGILDLGLSIASFRESLPDFCVPEFLDERKAGCRIDVENMYHPLLSHPVANSLNAEGGILLTGSNASGKSTFMKNMAVNAILAQALNTSLSEKYRGVVCKVMTSMALRDHLEQGESYFVAEARSLKRILEEAEKKEPLLCVMDEVLRGTNTTERIAAAESVLAALRKSNVICLAATHDIELTYLLEDLYANYHFEEKITEHQICFPYQLKPGRAKGKNAIALLGMLGVDPALVKRAEKRAADFEKTGNWSKREMIPSNLF